MTQYMSGKDGGALRNVGGRLDIDRSLHQDRLISTPNSAGSSKHAIGRPTSRSPAQAPQAPAPFDLSNLRQHLSPPPQQQRLEQTHRHTPSPQRNGPSEWASSFASQHAGPSHQQRPAGSGWGDQFVGQQDAQPSFQTRGLQASAPAQHNLAPWQRPPVPQYFHPHPVPQFTTFPALHPQQIPQHATFQPPQAESHQMEQVQQPVVQSDKPLTDSQEILARTAASFVDQLNTEKDILTENPKLANSNFMKLVNGLGERSIVSEEGQQSTNGEEVGEGAKFVERSTATDNWAESWMATTPTPSDTQQQGNSHVQIPMQGQDIHRNFGHYTSLQRAPDYHPSAQATNQISQSEWDRQFSDQEALVQSGRESSTSQRRKSVHFDQEAEEPIPMGNGVPSSLEEALWQSTNIPGATSQWRESLADDFDFDEETFYGFNGPMQAVRPQRWGAADTEGWKSMESDWEKYLEGMNMKDKGHYLFQAKNPYTAEMEVREQNNSSPTVKGVLELEAEVQNDPTSWEAWYSLGLKQQENEREDQAVLALSKVIQLEPDYRPSYLALAVSYTNEGQKEAANTMLSKWIDLGEEERRDGEAYGGTYEERRARLVERLIDMARASPEEVDADIQIALGVLFNSSEEYDKAEDCFSAALSVNPDDWLLYNRLGATLANSGRSEEAISLYHKALSLHPNFVRAHFNLGIAHNNLAQYPLAAQNMLNALRLQHADATDGYAAAQLREVGSKGVTSSTLWNSLRSACQHMGRHDLATLANKRDLAGFPMSVESQTETAAEF